MEPWAGGREPSSPTGRYKWFPDIAQSISRRERPTKTAYMFSSNSHVPKYLAREEGEGAGLTEVNVVYKEKNPTQLSGRRSTLSVDLWLDT